MKLLRLAASLACIAACAAALAYVWPEARDAVGTQRTANPQGGGR
jgi:hypothetical protein